MFQTIKNLFQVNKKSINNDIFTSSYDIFNTRALTKTDYLRLYKGWVYGATSVIADTVSNQDY
jgi:hypothetical protein